METSPVSDSTITSLPPQNEFLNESNPPNNKFKLILIFIGIIVIILVIGIVLGFKYLKNQDVSDKQASPSPIQEATIDTVNKTNFFKNGLKDIPLEKLELTDFPNFKDVSGIAHYQDKIWLSGDGSILEFDPKTNIFNKFSDPTQANCYSNIAIVGDFLFAPCRISNDNSDYRILKINLKNDNIDYIYTDKDGLLDMKNYKVYSDGDYVWVATFEGAARINSLTDQVEFFQKELGIEGGPGGISYSIDSIYPDKDYVAVIANASYLSKGGLTLYNKNTQKWQYFGPEVLKNDNDYERVDIEQLSAFKEAVKLVPGGIQIAFREDANPYNPGKETVIVEKQYNYSTGLWTKINSMLITGGENNYDIAREHLVKVYSPEEYSQEDQNGFTQIYTLGEKEPKYKINGRGFLSISKTNNGKRYLITGNSLDFVDATTSFPVSIMNFGRNIDNERPRPTEAEIKLYIPNNGSIMLVVDYYFKFIMDEGPDPWGPMKIWAIDLKSNKVLKEYESNKKYLWRTYTDLAAKQDERTIFLTKATDNIKIVEYDLQSNSFQVLDTKLFE